MLFFASLPFVLFALIPVMWRYGGMSAAERPLHRLAIALLLLAAPVMMFFGFRESGELIQAVCGLLVCCGMGFAAYRSSLLEQRTGALGRLALMGLGIYTMTSFTQAGIIMGIVLLLVGFAYPRLLELGPVTAAGNHQSSEITESNSVPEPPTPVSTVPSASSLPHAAPPPPGIPLTEEIAPVSPGIFQEDPQNTAANKANGSIRRQRTVHLLDARQSPHPSPSLEHAQTDEVGQFRSREHRGI